MAFDPDDDARSAIEAALLDYLRAPGKYARSARQPALLYSSITQVLQLASGRAPTSGAGGPSPSSPVQQAACFFLRSALLHPDASHYALLGLDTDASAAAVKERYRLMMRLMHPDFATTLTQSDWPADAATRLNQAYEVLSSPVQRRAYDDRLGAPKPAPRKPPASRASRPMAVLKVSEQARTVVRDPRRWLKRLAALFGMTGALALLAVAFTVGSDGKESLVQRPGVKQPPTVAAAPARPAMPQAPAPAPVQSPAPANPPMAAPGGTAPARQAPVVLAETVKAPSAGPAAVPAAAAAAATAAAPAPAIVMASAEPAAAPLAREAIAQAILSGIAPITPPTPPTPLAGAVKAPVAAAVKAPGTDLSLADVHPLLAKLLQRMESGWDDEVLSLLERDARSSPAAHALLLHYNGLVDGARPVKVSQVRFNAQRSDGGLLVTGHVLIQARNAPAPKPLALQAEFASRGGTVVMTRLARAPE